MSTSRETLCIFGTRLKSTYSTLDPDRPQHDRPTTFFIVRYYFHFCVVFNIQQYETAQLKTALSLGASVFTNQPTIRLYID